jgi:hypothetical protein
VKNWQTKVLEDIILYYYRSVGPFELEVRLDQDETWSGECFPPARIRVERAETKEEAAQQIETALVFLLSTCISELVGEGVPSETWDQVVALIDGEYDG